MRTSFALLALFFSSLAHAQELRKSPYFVDGVHCEGIEALEKNDELSLKYPDEVAAIARKARLQEFCEAIFSDAGMNKFQWVTPEDLEKMTFILGHSKRFQNVEVRLEKSELQNHVHVIGRFTLFEPKYYTRLTLDQIFERNKVNGDRSTTASEGTLYLKRRGNVSPAPISLGFKYFSSTADKALDKGGNSTDDVTTLSPEELISLSRPNGRFLDINAKVQHSRGAFAKFGLISSHLSGDNHSTADARVEAGTEFQYDPLSPSLTRLSVFYATYSADGNDYYDKKLSRRNSRSVAFAGVHQDFDSRYVKADVNIYRSLTPELHVHGKADFSLVLGRYNDVSGALGTSAEYLRGAILPEHRFGLPDRNQIQYYLKLETPFNFFGMDHVLSIRLGRTTLEAVNQLDQPYSKENAVGEFALKSVGENFDTSFAFTYGDRRLY